MRSVPAHLGGKDSANFIGLLHTLAHQKPYFESGTGRYSPKPRRVNNVDPSRCLRNNGKLGVAAGVPPSPTTLPKALPSVHCRMEQLGLLPWQGVARPRCSRRLTHITKERRRIVVADFKRTSCVPPKKGLTRWRRRIQH